MLVHKFLLHLLVVCETEWAKLNDNTATEWATNFHFCVRQLNASIELNDIVHIKAT